ncbi:hypothetical protein GUT189_07910 [Streptococcus ruminantium]|nr:hypothetical protein GUT189_07910 [Streptococcus ruminantium]
MRWKVAGFTGQIRSSELKLRLIGSGYCKKGINVIIYNKNSNSESGNKFKRNQSKKHANDFLID